MKKFLLLSLLAVLVADETEAQFTRYIVRFKNKGGTPYTFSSPLAYLSQRAVDRRTRYGIAIDSTDLPVTPSYVTQVKNVANVTLLNVSKWLNAVTIQTSDAAAITTINGFSFVQSVGGVGARNAGTGKTASDKFEEEQYTLPPAAGAQRLTADYFNYGTSSYNEIHLHNGEFLHNIGLRGQGMQIAMLDAGFINYNTLKAFDSANANGQILDKWNFVLRNTNMNVHAHGMQCLSTIAANIPGQFIGKAPKASFHLYCTEEDPPENLIEELNWASGAERADSVGSDVISTSLGYSTFDVAANNHTYADMNGNTTPAAIAADLAAKKGILVFASIGNDGNGGWHFLATPSDGDSVMAVGAVSAAGAVGSFSSYGPSSDGQIKPDMASVGVSALIQTTANTVGSGSGTSFACPNMAGLGTILWQGFPEYNNMKIANALRQAGHKFTTPDDRVGYGIPNMKTAFGNLLVEYATSNANVNNCTATVTWNSKDVSAMKYEVERKLPGETSYTKVGDVAAQAGSILANRSYTFNNTIVSPTAGTISYRIRQIIDTAAASFTAVYIDTAITSIANGCFATGTGGAGQTAEKVYVQPNPVSSGTATLVIETPYAIADMTTGVYDGKGRLMIQMKSSKASGKKTIDLNISRLAKGKYYIKVFNGTKAVGTAEMLKL